MITADHLEMTPAQAAQRDRLLHEMQELRQHARDLEHMIRILQNVNAALAHEQAAAETITVH
jgi:hypothetical protein